MFQVFYDTSNEKDCSFPHFHPAIYYKQGDGLPWVLLLEQSSRTNALIILLHVISCVRRHLFDTVDCLSSQ